MSHFDSQCWVNLTLNVDSIWLSMLSQFDYQCWVNMTLNVESIWLSMLSQFDSQSWVYLTLKVESIWLSKLSLFDSQCWANLTLNVEPIRLLMLSQFDSNILQLPNLPGRILVPQVTQIFFMSKWLTFSLSVSQLADITILNWTTRRLNQSIKISALVYRYQILEYFLQIFCCPL